MSEFMDEKTVTAVSHLGVRAAWEGLDDPTKRLSAVFCPPAGWVIVDHAMKIHERSGSYSHSASVLAGGLRLTQRQELDKLYDHAIKAAAEEYAAALEEQKKQHMKWFDEYSTTHNSIYAVVEATPHGTVIDRKRSWVDISVTARIQYGGKSASDVASELDMKYGVNTSALSLSTQPGYVTHQLWCSAGSSDFLYRYRQPYLSMLPPGRRPEDIVGMAIDGTNNFNFVWFRDGTVCAGSSRDLDSRRPPYYYRLPPGKTPDDIVGMAQDGSNNFSFAWYRDGTVSAGSTRHLYKHREPYKYTLPRGKTPDDIVGMAVDGTNNYNFVWFRDGTVCAGSSRDLDDYRPLYRYHLPPNITTSDVVGMAQDGTNNFNFVWFRDNKEKWRSS